LRNNVRLHETSIVIALFLRLDELGGCRRLLLLYFRKERRLAQQQVCALPQKIAAASGLSVQVISSPEAFAQCRSAWDRLIAESGVPHPFVSHAWLSAWWESFGQDKTLQIFVVKSGTEWIGAAPMMISNSKMYGLAVRRLDSIYNYHTPRSEFPVKPERRDEVFKLLWKVMSDPSADWDAVVLHQLVAASPTLSSFEKFARNDGWRTGRWTAPASPFIALGCTYETLLGRLSSNMRNNLRKRYMKLSEVGPVDIEIVDSASAVPSAMAEGLRIEAAAWKGQAGTAMMCDPDVQQFYTRLAVNAAQDGLLKLVFLRVNGKRIAFNYVLDQHGVLFGLKIGYDPDYQSYSPGNMLRALILQDACARGYREYDFLGVSDAWKLAWTKEARPHSWLFMFRDRLPLRLLHLVKFVALPALRRHDRLMRMSNALFGVVQAFQIARD
jgi:CelD/BcsL family acetyltransferase involved in cellulose biosynthesis